MNESRIEKSIINAKVNFTFYFIMLIMSFFSRRIFLNTLGDEFIKKYSRDVEFSRIGNRNINELPFV